MSFNKNRKGLTKTTPTADPLIFSVKISGTEKKKTNKQSFVILPGVILST